MKRPIWVLGIISFILISLIPAVFADDDNAFTKFGRGMANIVLSPGELYAQPVLMSKNNAESVSLFAGTLKGFSMFAKRELVGIYEVLTFPFPGSKHYKPIIEPATTFTDWDARSSKSGEAGY